MKIEVLDVAEIGVRGAAIIREGIESSAVRVLGVATGASPGPLYTALAAAPPRGIDSVRLFALDEYVGIARSNPQSYHSVVRREITGPLGLDPAAVRVLDGEAPDPVAECIAFEAEIAASGGVDLQILGIGSNGHIGFNEPGTDPSSRTRRARLHAATRLDNARFFDSLDDVPTHCLTQGIGTILEARHILLVARGAAKAAAIRQAVESGQSRATPASWLRDHPDVTVLLDAEAASALTR